MWIRRTIIVSSLFLGGEGVIVIEMFIHLTSRCDNNPFSRVPVEKEALLSPSLKNPRESVVCVFHSMQDLGSFQQGLSELFDIAFCAGNIGTRHCGSGCSPFSEKANLLLSCRHNEKRLAFVG